jgi:hypothetical protein
MLDLENHPIFASGKSRLRINHTSGARLHSVSMKGGVQPKPSNDFTVVSV